MILLKVTITIIRAQGAGTAAEIQTARKNDRRDKGVIFKNWASFTDSTSQINNTQLGNVKNLDVAMLMYTLIKYSDNYSETSGSLWQYYRDMLGVPDNAVITDTESFKSRGEIMGKTSNNDNTKDLEIAILLKYLSNFWRTLEITLIYCKINLILTWSANFVITNSTGAGTFDITDTKLYLPVVTLSINYNAKLLQELKSSLKQLTGININQR